MDRYPPLTDQLIDAYNETYANQPGKHMFSSRHDIEIVARSVPPGEEDDADLAIGRVLGGCNYPPGTTVVAVGKVKFGDEPEPIWVVFVNPANDHRVADPGSGGASPPLNWFAGLLTPSSHPRVFCCFGRSERLPPLPLHARPSNSYPR